MNHINHKKIILYRIEKQNVFCSKISLIFSIILKIKFSQYLEVHRIDLYNQTDIHYAE